MSATTASATPPTRNRRLRLARIPRDQSVTPWFEISTPPARVGTYRVQDDTIHCDCCWMDADFREGKFWQYGVNIGMRFRREIRVTRWCGLNDQESRTAPAVEGEVLALRDEAA